MDPYLAALIVGAPIIKNRHGARYCELSIGLDCDAAAKPFNPSVVAHGDQVFGVVRVDSFRPHLDQTYFFDKKTKGARNVLFRLDDDFNVVDPVWLSFRSLPGELRASWLSFEDLRLFLGGKVFGRLGPCIFRKSMRGSWIFRKKFADRLW